MLDQHNTSVNSPCVLFTVVKIFDLTSVIFYFLSRKRYPTARMSFLCYIQLTPISSQEVGKENLSQVKARSAAAIIDKGENTLERK